MPESSTDHKRNLAGFWFLGLTNNFAYVVMLSAATAILEDNNDNDNGTIPINSTATPPTNRSGHLLPYCNEIGTGAVLLADIIPTLIVKLSAPFYMHKIPYSLRVIIVVLLAASSFPIVAVSSAVWVSIIGIIIASLGAGFGEITFLSLSSHFNKNVVSTWSSGTGGAGLFGSLSYLGLISAGLSSRNSLLVMLVIPALMFFSYFFLMVIPASARRSTNTIIQARASDLEQVPIIDAEEELHASEEFHSTSVDRVERTLLEKLRLVSPLLKYMIPLALVYIGEYFINQALFELIYFIDSWPPRAQQYVWYQAIYQLGVFISRSSVNFLKIKHLWIMPILQFANVGFLLSQIFVQFVPSIWIIFAVILFEGLLGGATYVNAFYMISEEVADEDLEFSMGLASVADSTGITIAGIISVPVHNAICNA